MVSFLERTYLVRNPNLAKYFCTCQFHKNSPLIGSKKYNYENY